jgi:hypothetical protein
MTLLTNDDFAKRELSTSELETISAGLVLTHGPNPPWAEPAVCATGHTTRRRICRPSTTFRC